jgi:hypothetical protein
LSETIIPGLPRWSINAVSSRVTRQSRDRCVGDRCQTFPRNVIDDVQNAKPAAAGELVVNKIERPADIWLGLGHDRRPDSHGTTPYPPLAHREAFLTIEPVDAVDTRGVAFLPQQDEQTAVAETLPFIGELTQMLAQFRVWRPARPVTDHLAIGIDD